MGLRHGWGTRADESVEVSLLLVGEGLVSEPDVAELYGAGAVAGDGIGGRDDDGRGVDELEDAFGGSHGRLQDVVFLAEVLNGAEEALRVLDETDEDADGDRSEEAGDAGRMQAERSTAAEKSRKARRSRLKSWTTGIPETYSWVKELMRAVAARWRR